MTVAIRPCRVPWAVSPSSSGLTLIHAETPVAPECSITFGGNRIESDGKIVMTRVELVFALAAHTRTLPKGDDEDIDASGFSVLRGYDGLGEDYLDWRERTWLANGWCPDSGFYLVPNSDYLRTARKMYGKAPKHYLLVGRDGYIEVIADSYSWREWLWLGGERDSLTNPDAAIASGRGVE